MQLKSPAVKKKKKKKKAVAITKSFPGSSYSQAHTVFHQQICAGLQLSPGDHVSVWRSQSAATPGPFGWHPHVQCYSLEQRPWEHTCETIWGASGQCPRK